MKKLLGIAAIVLALGGATLSTASAQEWGYGRDYDRGAYDPRARWGGEEWNRLNWQINRVDEKIRYYGASRYVRARFSEIVAERDRLSWQWRRGAIDPYRASRRVEYLRNELRQLEYQLHRDRGRAAIGIRVY